MTFIQILAEFLAYKFPLWGVCHLKFEPQLKILYIHSYSPEKRRLAIIRDASAIASLDIGIEKFIFVQQGYGDIIIPKVKRRNQKDFSI
jgi:hypothetical protein